MIQCLHLGVNEPSVTHCAFYGQVWPIGNYSLTSDARGVAPVQLQEQLQEQLQDAPSLLETRRP